MADESFQERTEAATPRRRQQARERGQVPRSPEVGSALLILATALALGVAGGRLADGMVALFGRSALVAAAPPAGIEAMTSWVRGLGWHALLAMAPMVLLIAGLGGAAAAVQARGTLTLKPLQPELSRLSPAKNAKRLFGLQSVVELLKALFKLAIVGGAVYVALARAWPELATLSQQSPGALLEVVHKTAVRLLLTAGAALLALGGADYFWQLWRHEKELRMSREEVKREHKETEGDPMIKARLRSIGRSMARQRMLTSVPSADLVITNPTHIAVALRYDPTVSPAPIVLALGQRKLAERIKQIAREAGVPCIENRPLARALLATAKVGLPIPTELYMAVAEVLAFVIRQRRRVSGWKGAVVE